MKQHQRLVIPDRSLGSFSVHPMIRPIPRCRIDARMFANPDRRAPCLRPRFEIFLVRIFPVFQPIVTPIQTRFAPTLQTGQGHFVATKGQDSDIKLAMFLKPRQFSPEAVGRDQNARLPRVHLGPNRAQRSKTKKIRIQIGDLRNFRSAFQKVARPTRRQRKVIFHPTATKLH